MAVSPCSRPCRVLRGRALWRAKEQATEAAAVTCKLIATTCGRAACADGERTQSRRRALCLSLNLRRLCCLLALWLGSRLCCRWPPPVPPVGSVARLSALLPMAAACAACWLCGSALGLCSDGRRLCCLWPVARLSALLPMAAASVACGLWLGLSALLPMAAACVPVGSVARHLWRRKKKCIIFYGIAVP